MPTVPPFAASWRRAVGAMAERVASAFHGRCRPAGAIRTLNASSRVSGNNLSSPAASTTEHALGLIVSLRPWGVRVHETERLDFRDELRVVKGLARRELAGATDPLKRKLAQVVD